MTDAQDRRQKARDKQGKYTAYIHAKPSINLGVPNMNSGYVGYSMSLRAMEAYEDGEMPKSKWTKNAMLGAIYEHVEDESNAEEFMDWVSSMKKDEIFDEFFYNSSWHHTGKYANVTDFYAADEEKVYAYCYISSLSDEEKRQLVENLERDNKELMELHKKENEVRVALMEATPYDPHRPSPGQAEAEQRFIDAVEKSGVFDAPDDMTARAWAEQNPSYEQDICYGYVTFTFGALNWHSYSSIHQLTMAQDDPMSLVKKACRQQITQYQESIQRLEDHRQFLVDNKETFDALHKEFKKASGHIKDKEKEMKKYPSFLRFTPEKAQYMIKKVTHE